jgi:hypothetical protein
LHALDHFELGLERFGFFDRDHTLVADFLHGIGKKAPDLGIAISRNGANLGDLIVRGDLLRMVLKIRDYRIDCEVDAAFQIHRVHPGGNRLGTFPDDRVRQYGGGRRAVAGLVGGLRCNLAHHLGAHVLELVLKLDFLGDSDAVLGHAGSAERLVEQDVAALGTERYAHRMGECLDAVQHSVPSID